MLFFPSFFAAVAACINQKTEFIYTWKLCMLLYVPLCTLAVAFAMYLFECAAFLSKPVHFSLAAAKNRWAFFKTCFVSLALCALLTVLWRKFGANKMHCGTFVALNMCVFFSLLRIRWCGKHLADE